MCLYTFCGTEPRESPHPAPFRGPQHGCARASTWMRSSAHEGSPRQRHVRTTCARVSHARRMCLVCPYITLETVGGRRAVARGDDGTSANAAQPPCAVCGRAPQLPDAPRPFSPPCVPRRVRREGQRSHVARPHRHRRALRGSQRGGSSRARPHSTQIRVRCRVTRSRPCQQLQLLFAHVVSCWTTYMRTAMKRTAWPSVPPKTSMLC